MTDQKNYSVVTHQTKHSGLTGATPCNFFTILEPFLGDACQISNAEAWKRVTADPVRGSLARRRNLGRGR
jgi:hypothetical protein